MQKLETEIPSPQRVYIQPGPNMHWFEQGFYMGFGFLIALCTFFLLYVVVVALLFLLAVGGLGIINR